MALQELLRKAELDGDVDFLRDGVRVLAQELMEIEVAQHVGAEKYERGIERTGERNGYRDRTWDTRVGSIELRVPRVRDGGYYPALLEPRRRGERALVAVVQEAYVQGVSTRRVDDLVKALGMNGISKSQVSRLCQALDTEVERFRTRKLDSTYPFCWLDATFLKVRHDHRVVSMAVVIAVGVNQDGQREVLGVDVGPSEDSAFWLAFLRSLVARGLSGVRLGHERQPPGSEERDRSGAAGCELAAEPHALCRPPDYADTGPFPKSRGLEEVGITLTVSVGRGIVPSARNRRLFNLVHAG